QRDDALALEVDDEPEHAVRARVLRPDVDAHPLRLERAEVLVPGRAGLGQLRRHQLSPASSASRLLVRRERGWGSWTERTPARAPPFQPVSPGSLPVRPARNE